ncbi:MAG TPA: outer membrane protein assembly factor BamA [Thermoanaerobaculia bacterium]|nr:outer membrane protein assembly factor BamA [Thermoanaerobaculia bacterium]
MIQRRLATPREPSRRFGFQLSGAFLAALLLLVPAARAASPYDGKRIESVTSQGLVLLSEETLLFYLGLAKGQPLDSDALDQKISELWTKQLIDDLQVDVDPEGEGVHLTLKVKERPVLRSVQYKGLKRLGKTDIDDRIAKEGIDLGEGHPLDRGEIARLESLLETMYQEKGYRFAQITTTYAEAQKGEVSATVTVDEGDKVRIGDIDFEGNEVFGDLRLRWVMKKTKQSGLVTRLLKKDIYNPASLEEDLDKVRDLYRGAGYKNVLVGEPRTEVKESGSKRRLVLVIPIDEGERWKLGKVTMDGNTRYKSETLLSLVPIREGGWLRSDQIDKAVEKIKQSYDNSGYIFSRVTPELVERDNYIADVVIKVAENDQFKVGRIEFEGNTDTRDKVLRRELRVQEGLFINLGGVKNSVYKVNQLGFFKLKEGEPVKFDPDNENKLVNLTFVGHEDNRTELQFGAGYGEQYGFFGQLSFRTYNFLGRGETVGVSVESGQRRDLFDVSYLVPWFLDRPQSIGYQLSKRQEQLLYVGGAREERNTLGGTVNYNRNFGLFQSVGLSYNRYRFDGTFIGQDSTGQEQRVSLGEVDSSSITPAWYYNSVDNRFEPTRGQRMRASVELGGGPLGGNNWFYKFEGAYTLFRPVTNYPVRTVFGLNLEAGWVRPFGTERDATGKRVDRPLQRFERYLLGGDNSVRGFRYPSIAVRDANNKLVLDPLVPGAVLGGDEFLQINVEYHILLGGPFRLILFADGGNVWSDFEEEFTDPQGVKRTRLVHQSIDPGNLRWSAGAELRLLVPVFGAPLRFIYAKPLDDKLPDDRFESFRFSIGAAF